MLRTSGALCLPKQLVRARGASSLSQRFVLCSKAACFSARKAWVDCDTEAIGSKAERCHIDAHWG